MFFHQPVKLFQVIVVTYSHEIVSVNRKIDVACTVIKMNRIRYAFGKHGVRQNFAVMVAPPLSGVQNAVHCAK